MHKKILEFKRYVILGSVGEAFPYDASTYPPSINLVRRPPVDGPVSEVRVTFDTIDSQTGSCGHISFVLPLEEVEAFAFNLLRIIGVDAGKF